MEEVVEEDLNKTATKVLESPKPVAFTVDFGENRPLDTTKYKSLVEKYEKFKHRRNQSLSKIEDIPKQSTKKPLTEKLPRKTSFEKEGYVSSDEKSSSGRSQLLQTEKSSKRVQNHQVLRSTVLNTALRKDLTLPLKQTNNDRMTQSFPSRSFDLPTIDSPELELKDVSSPDMDLISPLSPFVSSTDIKSIKNHSNENITSSSEDCMVEKFKSCVEINENEINEKETDNVSEAGTYTIETDNYTEEQKQRMSIDQDFDIEHVPSDKKTEEYVQNLMIGSPMQITDVILQKEVSVPTNFNNRVNKVVNLSQRVLKSEYSPTDDLEDRGVFTLVTASGVLNKQQKKLHHNSHNLVKSVVALETYPSNLITENRKSVKDQNTTKKNQNIQRSSSTANIKPKIELNRRSSINSDSQERNNYIETDSSSEDDYEKNLTSKPKKDLTTTRYNRAFSLRRARLDIETPPSQPKCPNTPEMKRKFAERTVSVDRKSSLHQSISSKNADVQPRYMNITKAPPKSAPPKSDNQLLRNNNSNFNPNPKNLPKPQPSFSRTDSGRFSLRSPRINVTNKNVPNKKDPQGKKQSGPRSNSTLSSREVEFQNWKRRKSYDPMKAAAEGKRKAELAKKCIMTQSYNENNQDYDSSPSHSSSVHRSQSFHGTAALESNLISSEDDELTLSGEDGFSPPIPSPSHQNMSPIINKNQIKAKFWKDKFQK